MKLAEIREARNRMGLSLRAVGSFTGFSDRKILNIEKGIRTKKKDVDKLLRLLGLPGSADDIEDVEKDEYCIGRKPENAGRHRIERRTPHVYHDTLALDNKEATRLGLSYGEYMTKKETGTLELWKKQQAELAKRDSKANIIQSHLGGSPGARKITNASKL